jgi:phosphopentomutase
MSRRAFVVVIDACGAGALPDAASYGDAGSNTLLHVAQALGGLQLPTLQALGLGNILELPGVAAAAAPALHGLLHPLGPGKDSTNGHWELMGVTVDEAPPSYPDGLPPELIALIEQTIGAGVICARPYDGVAAIEDFGAEHLASGRPILYTSQDSVLQLAAHTAVMGEEQLYAACVALRAALARGPHAVRRVIARPFQGSAGNFERTLGRRDYTLEPPSRSYLELLREAGTEVHAVGKAAALFDDGAFSAVHPGASNAEAIASVEALIGSLEQGLVFANLIETDQRYGHRHDAAGFHEALQLIDAALARWLPALGEEDLLVITADHGCDPAASHTDHTREYAPLLARFDGDGGRRHDGPLADVGASVLDWLTATVAPLPGRSFIADA